MAKKVKTDDDLLARLDRITELLTRVSPEVLGNRFRRQRDQQGLSIREVAERAGISKNSIVRLEQGRGTQAVTVMKVCSVLAIHIERLAEPSTDDVVAAVHLREDDRWFDVADMASQPLLGLDRPLKPAERKKARTSGAQTPVKLLQARLEGGRVLPSLLEISEESPQRSHVGEEFAYVLRGEAIITVGGQEYRLKEGEALTFWSAEPHSYAPADPKKVPVQILSVRVD